jgi:AmmeMemoRadiSam system protein A
MRSAENGALGPRERRALLEIARASIEHGLQRGAPLHVDGAALPPALREPGAAFVTLRRNGDLRGCIGELAPSRALAESVAHHAWAAAFRDPRFAPLEPVELGDLDVHIAVVGPHEPLDASSEAALLAALRPGVDGVIVDDGALHRATFLPAVWASLPEPREFVRELARKAGLPPLAWPPTLRAWRYAVEEIP